MSGQAGIWNFDAKPVDETLLTKFSETLRHHGPDEEFVYRKGEIGMVYRPFHTTSESRLEQQPYRSHGGHILTWDGRLDNRIEVMTKLGTDLRDNPTDVEIVAAAFERWGAGCFQSIIGDWAVSIWSAKKQELIIAVDYVAIRHIFYYLRHNCIWWSTDLSALAQLSGDRFSIDEDYIAGYFANDPDAHVTPYREIRQVPAGKFVRIHNRTATMLSYWRPGSQSPIRYRTDAEYEEHFRHVFRQSVRRRMRSDSPILAELSGGLDSSSIVCMADEILATEPTCHANLDTLSFYDRTDSLDDDWTYLQKVEQKRNKTGFHIDANQVNESPSSVIPSDLISVPGYVGSWRVLEQQRADIVHDGNYRVVLSGLGGDEFMGGIPDPRALLADLVLLCRPIDLFNNLIAWSLTKRKPLIHLLSQALLELMPAVLRRPFVKESRVEDWLEPAFVRRTSLSLRQIDATSGPTAWLPTRRSFLMSLTVMTNKMAKRTPPQLKLEELRYPYLDRDLIDFVLSIPATQLLRPGERRSLMRRSLKFVVPAEILSRRTKQIGSRTPLLTLDQNQEEIRTLFTSSISARLGIINEERLLAAVQKATSGQKVNRAKLLAAVALEAWLREIHSRGLLLFGNTPAKSPEPNLQLSPSA